ncbi:acid-sensing ion channel 4 [Petaurus breviceps papuanus]|uniref:acid-sensing ion channel 4 n=1 Tax=Petaurus breviceps papuanus TaxID=3040969 RepID=UPI0036DF2497
MPIEIVCKIKFSEEDAKPKEKEEGDEQSLLGAACQGAPPRDLATFASSSTLHGLGHACGRGPRGLRRSLWALALLASLAAFLYQAVGLARSYLARPHLVSLDPAGVAPALGFPAVTLCNINRFRHSALSDADIFHLANLTGLPPKDRDGHRAAGLRYPEPDMVDILNRTGHQLADMLKSCNFSGHHCSASNFSVVSPTSWCAPGTRRGHLGWGGRMGVGILDQDSPFPLPPESLLGVSPGLRGPSLHSIRGVLGSVFPVSTLCPLSIYQTPLPLFSVPLWSQMACHTELMECFHRENFLVLDVFFEALTSESVKQRAAYGLSALLGDIGGQMGLFIGASVLTFLEILDYIYEVSWDRLKRTWRRPKPPLRTSTGGISTLGLQELKEQSSCPGRGCAEAGGASSLLPNHHHPHGPPGGLFEDFAC